MNKNVCIIHFNTPVLTSHLVMSINKHTPGTHIYIFDNSDKRPFENSFGNVTVFDNTKGQIINFNEWLKKYPDKEKSGGKANNWGSAKHAYSVEKCMELIKEPFVLFDSDVLVKKDFAQLFDDAVCYKGEVIYQPNSKVKRVLPFICFINTPMCLSKKIHYFDEKYMHGLRVGLTGDRYDTGAALYLLTERNKAPHREIKVSDYIVHYGNGSWVNAAEKIRKPKHIPAAEWLEKYKDFWKTNENKQKEIKHTTFKSLFDRIYCLHYLPLKDRFENVKKEFNRVGIDTSADYFSWVYDYPSPLLDTVYNDKRINMGTVLKSTSREYIKRVSMKHYEIIKEAYTLGYERILITEDDIKFHISQGYIDEMFENMPDSDVVMFDKMTSSSVGEAIKYKKYLSMLPEGTLYGSMNDSGVFFIFCSCYSLNRKAMERIISLQENMFLPPDTPLNDKTLTGSFAITNLAIQDPKTKTRKVESYDRIGLDTTKYGCENAVEAAEHTIIRQPMKVKQVSNDTFKKKEPVKIAPSKTVNKTVRFKPVTPAKKDITFEVKKNNPVRTRTIQAKVTGHNKLYDVF